MALTSLKSVDSEETTTGRQTCLRTVSGSGSGRRFSNISNLAFDLSSTTTSAPRLQGVFYLSSSNWVQILIIFIVEGGGSLELGFVLEDGTANQKSANPRPALSSVRRTLSALETSSASPSSAHAVTTSSAPQYESQMSLRTSPRLSKTPSRLSRSKPRCFLITAAT